MSPLKQHAIAVRRLRRLRASFRNLVALLALPLSLPAFGGGVDVSPDELYSDDVTLTSADGAALDINGDGFVDLLVGTNAGDPASASRYYPGNGDGTFQATPVLLDNRATSEVLAADFNGDAFIDLVQGVRDLRSRLYIGDGAGGVGQPIDILDSDRVLAVAVGDLDNDGDPDLVTGTGHAGGEPGTQPLQENRFYLNASVPAGGTPTFTGTDIAADADDTRSIALADLDGDGDLDVIAGNDETTPGSNRFYLNQLELGGGVSFAPGVDFGPADDQTSKILVGDLDNDGDLDVVALNFVAITGGVTLSPGIDRFFLNQLADTSTFSLSAANDVSAEANHSSGGVLADFDADGDLDLAVANLTTAGDSARNRLYLNQFIPSGAVSFVGSDISPDEHNSRELAAADIDGDGDLDIVAGNQPLTGVPGRDRRYLGNGTADPFTNVAPVIDAQAGALETPAETPLALDVAAVTVTDPDNIPADLTLTVQPGANYTVDANVLTPDAGFAGDLLVPVVVSDGTDDSAAFELTVTVSGPTGGNNPPAFTSTPVTEATEGASYTYDITAADPDSGATLAITAPTLPAWLALTDNGDGTAALSGTPAAAEVGDHAVSLQVSDGTDTAAQAFTITVSAAPNNPPAFTSTPVTEATEDAAYTYGVTASDPDSGASLAITAPTVPAWLTLTDNGDGTATLSGTPAAGDVGEHAVSLQVTDGTDAAVQDFSITVAAAADDPPPTGGASGDDSGGGSPGLVSLLALAAYAAVRRRRRNG